MLRRLAIASVLVLMLASCSSQETAPEHPQLSPYFKNQFDMYLGYKITDKQREILSDYWVTDEEWIDISSDFHACMEPTGIEGSLRDDQFGYSLSEAHQRKIDAQFDQDSDKVFAQFDKDLEVVADCAYKTADPIGLLYFEPRSNPDGVSGAETIRRCLEEQGIRDLDTIPESELDDYLFSGEYDSTSTPERRECFSNPAYGEFAPHNN